MTNLVDDDVNRREMTHSAGCVWVAKFGRSKSNGVRILTKYKFSAPGALSPRVGGAQNIIDLSAFYRLSM